MMVIIMIFETIGKKPRSNQYGSHYVEQDGLMFDSSREAHRYLKLKELQEVGSISGLEVHRKFTLLDGFRDRHGEWHRPITYTPDFVYRDNVGDCLVAEDVKSEATVRDDVWMLKKKMFLAIYGKQYDFRIVG